MKLLVALLITSAVALQAQTAGQSSIPKKNSGAGFTNENVTIGNSQVLGRKADGTLSGFTLGSGLTLTGGTLSANSSSADWGDLTSVPAPISTLAAGFGAGHSPAYVLSWNGTDYEQLTGIDASLLTTGTLPVARIANGSITTTKITGLATSATVDATNAGNIGSGTLGAARLPSTVVQTTDTGTVTNTMLAGSIANAKLANSSITINGTSVSLGGTITVSGGLTIGTTTITSGTSGNFIYNNAGVVGEKTPAQVLSAISGAGLGANTFTGLQSIAYTANAGLTATALGTGDLSSYVYSGRTAQVVIGTGATTRTNLRIVMVGSQTAAPLSIEDVYGNVVFSVPTTGAISLAAATINAITQQGGNYYNLETSGNDWRLRNASNGTVPIVGKSSGQVQFGTTAKLASYTVAGLPSASTEGAGAMAFVTDATATTAYTTVSGGGSNKVLVISDGTNWIVH